MVLEGLLTILQSLIGWLLMVIWQMTLRIVDILERFFNVLAGTDPVYYKGEETYLFNLFFSNRAITNLFWAMAIIAIVISFGFCIVAVARKVTDISGTSKHTIGQIMSNFIRSLVVILLLNICIVAAINVTTVVFDRINFSLENAEELHREQERTYTDEEFATMARILSTMANYASNPSAESRYNVNACFNAIRGEMLTLFETKCFDYDFPVVQTGKHTWQSALAQVAKSANLKEDLQLDTYYPSVQEAIILCFKELKTNLHFKPQETAVLSGNSTGTISTAKLIFLVSTMGAEENEQFLNGNYEDALRRSYINGERDYLSYTDADKDFAITKINYLIGLIVSISCIIFSGKIVLVFVTRMLNIMLLYVVSPLFASSMTLDEGSRFQNWTQSFVMQLLASYASVVMMRIYLLMVPMVVNNELHFLAPETSSFVYFDIYGQLLFVLAGAWAVSKANSLITGALTGNASSALQESDNAFGQMISGAIGPSALMRELQRARHNRDRAKSSQKGHEKAEETKQQQKQQKQKSIEASRDRGRNNVASDKQRSRDDSSVDGSSAASLERMREGYGISNDVGNSQSSVEAEDHFRASSGLNRMREEMGLDNPNAPDSFNIDALPDLGRPSAVRGSNGVDGGEGTAGANGGIGRTAAGKVSSTIGAGTRTVNTTESGNKTGATIAGGGRTSVNSTKPANNVRTMATSVGGATVNTTESGNKTGATIAGGGRTSMNSTKPANNVRTMATSVGGATVNTTESGNKTGATIAGGDRTSVNSTNPGNATKTTAATGGGATVNTTASVHNTGPLNVGLDTTPTMVTRESTRNDTVEIGSTGNKGERGTVGISGTKGRDGERGTSGLDGRDSIKNMNHSAPDLTRNRASSIAAGSKVNRSAQMKDNLKARINERKNNE